MSTEWLGGILVASVPQTASLLMPLESHWGLLAAFMGVMAVLLTLDLALFHRNPTVVTWKSAALGVAFWVSLGLAFNGLLWWLAADSLSNSPQRLVDAGLVSGLAAPAADIAHAASTASRDIALQWLAGYIVELSLSVDNLFVFVVVLRYFAIPAALHHRVLFWGIVGAVVLRAVFISAGLAIIHQFDWVAGVFGAFLVVTGFKLMSINSGGAMMDPGRTLGFRLLKLFLPLHREFAGQQFFSRKDTKLVATPLLAALVVVEFSDIVFAVDSVPAVLAITREPVVAFTSNIAAVLGLRAMYFLLANAVDRFHLLKPALGIVLVFVGLKMTWQWWYGTPLLPIAVSLSIVVGIIALGSGLSLLLPARTSPPNPDATT